MGQIAPLSKRLLRVVVPYPSPEFQVPFLEAGARACKFILGEASADAVCCGAPTDGRSWCLYHRRIVFPFGKAGPLNVDT